MPSLPRYPLPNPSPREMGSTAEAVASPAAGGKEDAVSFVAGNLGGHDSASDSGALIIIRPGPREISRVFQSRPLRVRRHTPAAAPIGAGS